VTNCSAKRGDKLQIQSTQRS